MSFQYFLKRVSALKFSLTATEDHAYNSVPSVESLKLIPIIGANLRQKVQKVKMRNFFLDFSALSGLKLKL